MAKVLMGTGMPPTKRRVGLESTNLLSKADAEFSTVSLYTEARDGFVQSFADEASLFDWDRPPHKLRPRLNP